MGVLRHRIGGDRQRVSDASPRGLSDIAKDGEPAYPLGPHSVRPRRRLAGDRAPCDPLNRNYRHGRAFALLRIPHPASVGTRTCPLICRAVSMCIVSSGGPAIHLTRLMLVELLETEAP